MVGSPPTPDQLLAGHGRVFPLAANSQLDPTTLPAFHALAKHLMQ